MIETVDGLFALTEEEQVELATLQRWQESLAESMELAGPVMSGADLMRSLCLETRVRRLKASINERCGGCLG